MAKSSEHKMLFDIRGRRKRVIQVVYVALALLMALSLFTVVGPVSLGDVFGGGSSSSDTGFDDQAEQIERKLARDPRNEQLLVRDVKARYTSGNTQIQYDPATGTPTQIPEEAFADFEKAGNAWLRYMKVKPADPSVNVAQLAATALFYSAAASSGIDFQPKVEGAADAQRLFAEARPSLNAYLTLARYEFIAGDFAAGEEAGRKAAQEATGSQQRAVEQTVAQFRKLGQQIQKQIKAATKFQPGGGGQQALENPLGGLSGGGGGLGQSAP